MAWGTFNISGASYDSKSLSLAAKTSSSKGIFISDDGFNLYVADITNSRIIQYTMSSAFNLSTATYTRVFSVSAEDSAIRQVFFSTDGKKMYVFGANSNSIFQYTLSTAWDLSTASYAFKSFNVAPDGTFYSFCLSNSGSRVYALVFNGSSQRRVASFTLGTAWDISTASRDNKEYNFTSQDNDANGIFFNDTLSVMFLAGNQHNSVYQYTLSTPGDVTTASYSNSKSLSSEGSEIDSISFKRSDGTKLYSLNYSGSGFYVFQYTAYTPSTNWTKSLAETLSLADSLSKTVNKKNTDNPAIVDSLTKLANKKMTENPSLADSISRADQVKRTETLSLSDSIVKTISKYLTDHPNLADVFIKTIGKNPAEAINLDDSLANIVYKYLTENPTLSDVILKTNGKYQTELLSLSDTIQKMIGKYQADTISLSDVLKFVNTKNLTEILAVTDIGLILTINTILSENIQISDSVSLMNVYNRVISESLPLSDAISAVSEYLRTLDETVALADDLKAYLIFAQDLSEIVNLQDRFKFDIGKYTADNLTLNDVIVTLSLYYKNLLDNTNLSDEIKTTIEKNLTENLATNDSLTFSLEKILLDMTILSDLFSALINKSIADGINLNDSSYIELGRTIHLAEDLVVSEILVKDVNKNLTENSSVVDYINTATEYRIGIQDSISVIERLVRQYDIRLVDAISLVDNLQKYITQPMEKRRIIPRNAEKAVVINQKKDRIILISKI